MTRRSLRPGVARPPPCSSSFAFCGKRGQHGMSRKTYERGVGRGAPRSFGSGPEGLGWSRPHPGFARPRAPGCRPWAGLQNIGCWGAIP
eukprot:4063904-Pyramimonas_sp.AAC.1